MILPKVSIPIEKGEISKNSTSEYFKNLSPLNMAASKELRLYFQIKFES
jgi:hypothetical protein